MLDTEYDDTTDPMTGPKMFKTAMLEVSSVIFVAIKLQISLIQK